MAAHLSNIDRLLLLHQISAVMQGSLDLDQVFHVILSACTAGEGLGFNRAFLFLRDRERNELTGRLGVGPESAEDCARIWGAIGGRAMAPREFIDSLEKTTPFHDTQLTRRVRDVSIPLEHGSGIIAQAVAERRALLVDYVPAGDSADQELSSRLELERFAVIPLVAKGEVEGAMIVDNKFNQRPINEDDLLLLEVLGGQAAVAIRNARLYEQVEQLNQDLERRVRIATADLQKRLEQLSLLHDIDLAILKQHHPAEILYQVVERALQLCDATCGAIMLVNEDEKSMEVQASRAAQGEGDHAAMLQVGAWVAEEVAIKGVPKTVDGNDLLGQHLFCSILAVPMTLKNKVAGVIYLARPAPSRFAPADVEVLSMLAREAMVVLHNARMYEEVERRFREVASLSEVQQAIVSSLDLPQTLNLIVRRATEVIMGAEACVIRLREGEDNRLVEAASYIYPGCELCEADVRRAEAEIKLPPAELTVTPTRMSNYSVVSVPLRVRENIIGMMNVYWRPPENAKSEHAVIIGFASQAATAIENVRLYHNLARSYQELRQAQAALTQKEKLAVLGEMAATVAHEIRNPLTAIRGYSQRIGALASKPLDERDVRRIIRYSGIIIGEVDRLNAVVADVLNFARRGADRMAPADLNAMIRDVLRLEQINSVSTNVLVTTDLNQHLPPVVCDANQIKQALINLVQNALQAMPDGGLLDIETRFDDARAYIVVKDTGNGIPEELMDKIFQPFFTTRPTGTGLGLSLAKRVIEEDHRGTLDVQSRPGEGTTFTIALPLRGVDPLNA